MAANPQSFIGEKDSGQRLAALRAVPLSHLDLDLVHLSLVQSLACLRDGHTPMASSSVLTSLTSQAPFQKDKEIGHHRGLGGLII
jgi:hypothetical protein